MGPVKQLFGKIRGQVSGWIVTGAIVAITGFTPQEWSARLFRHFPEFETQWQSAIDPRVVLVALGTIIVVCSVLLQNRLSRRLAFVGDRGSATGSTAGQAAADASGERQVGGERATSTGAAKSSDAAKSSSESSALEKPSIAVLPFENMSGDAEQDHFCDGLVEDIITTLSKLAGLRVIARNSCFVYKARSVDVREAARQLGVRYVLEGSVRRSGNRIRVTAQLIDGKDGTHLWADRYDRAMDDIFAIQDEITLVLATEMQVKLTEGEQARLRYTTTSNVEAWSNWAQGMIYFRQAITRENMAQARIYFEKALALDPASAALNAMVGYMHKMDARFGWWDDRETAIGKASACAERALALDPGNADAHIVSGMVLLARGRCGEAVAAARRAIELAPGSGDVAALAGAILTPSGYLEDAVVQIEKAMTLSPNYPPYYLGMLGDAYRLSGRTEQAIAAFKAYRARSPGFGLTDLVIIYQERGQADEAKQMAEQLLAARPNFTIASWLDTQVDRQDQTQVEADLAALRAAGLPMN
jgi:adenylate cyclase